MTDKQIEELINNLQKQARLAIIYSKPKLAAELSMACSIIEQLQKKKAELKLRKIAAEKMNNVHVKKLSELDKEIAIITGERDRAENEMYMRREETKKLRARLRKLESALRGWIEANEGAPNKYKWAKQVLEKKE